MGLTTADLDISESAGRVIGGITVNGVPLASHRIVTDVLCGDWGNDAAGIFGHFVPDAADTCAATATGAVLNDQGCSIDDLIPCDGGWKSRGAYVQALARVAESFLDQALIDAATKDALVARAVQSACGT